MHEAMSWPCVHVCFSCFEPEMVHFKLTVDVICTCYPTEKLLSSNTLVQDRSVEEAEKGSRGKLLQRVLHLCVMYSVCTEIDPFYP